MKRKKLVILAGPLDNQSAGIHRVTYEMIKALHDYNDLPFDVTIIREKSSTDFPNFKTIALPALHFIPGFQSLRLFVLLPIICMMEGANYVFEPAHFGPFNLPSKIKRITLIHDLTPVLFPQYHRFMSALLQKMFLPGILKKTDLILALSDNTIADITNQYPKAANKVRKISIGPSSYLSYQADESHLDTYNIKRPYILSFGTIEPRKNLSLLLKAFEVLKEDPQFNHQLVIAGKYGWKHEDFDLQLEESKFKDDIILTSYIKDEEISSLYSFADTHVICSHYEGFGISAFESMYLNVPTVLPNNSSFIETGAEYAVFYESNDLQDLLSALRKTLNIENNSIGKFPLSAYYSWENFRTQFLKELKEV